VARRGGLEDTHALAHTRKHCCTLVVLRYARTFSRWMACTRYQ
jgi:hypothetical protein